VKELSEPQAATKLLLSICKSLTACENQGDVADIINAVLLRVGYTREEIADLFDDSGDARAEWFEQRGIKGLYER